MTERKRIVHLSTAHKPLDVRIFEKECRSLLRLYERILGPGDEVLGATVAPGSHTPHGERRA